LVNAGLYALSKQGLETVLPETGKVDLAKHTFPAMLQSGMPLAAYVSPEYIKDLGTPGRLDKVIEGITSGVAEMRSGRNLRAAIFLDRDGTLNREIGHLHHPDQLELLPQVASAIQKINHSGRLAVAITNQPVIARGELTQEGLEAIHARLDALLGVGHAYLDALYLCPHHPHHGYEGEVKELKIECTCRKPQTGMIDQACKELFISRHNSWFVGDATSDMEAGRRAGLRTMLVRTGYAGRDGKFPVLPDYITPNLLSAINWILEDHPKVRTRLFPFVANHLQARMILVGGLSRSGKSSVAQVLKELFAAACRRAHVISLDSWLLPPEARQEGAGVLSRYDLPEAVRRIREVLDPSSRHRFQIPSYDPLTRMVSIEAPAQSIGPNDVLIVEGVPVLALQELVSLADARLYIEAEEAARQARLLEDYRWRGLTDEQIKALLRSRTEDETAVVTASRIYADFSLFP
jgi:D,D-heptose 1,7-bisphosphate phosphatase